MTAPALPADAQPDLTARAAGLVGCHGCSRLFRQEDAAQRQTCPRCAAPLHRRKPDSLNRTTALVATAAILYIPANYFPVLTVKSFGKGAPSTILGGVEELIAANQWSLALLVLFASILVPMLKLLVLSYLIWSVRTSHTHSRWRLRDRTRLFRLTETIGRWSMIDMFMTSILVALVKLGAVATIEAGPGATFFCAVVVVTMIAAMSFDPRLIWDHAEESS